MANWVRGDQKLPQGRLILVSYMIVLGILLLLVGFWKLQIVQAGHFSDLARKNRIRTIPIIAPRGKILDRDGRVLVDNYPSFSILLLRDDPAQIKKDLPQITSGLDVTARDLEEQLRVARNEPKFQPLVIKEVASDADLAFVEAHRMDLPELELMLVQRRRYPPDDFLSPVVGYVGEVSPEQLEQSGGKRYKPGDIVGKAGLEREYNDILTGTDGMRRMIVNSTGKPVRTLDDMEPIPGKPIQLTIDADLQHVAEQELVGKTGAIVAWDPQNGEILAMASRPAFDPNDFAVRISAKEWNALNDDPEKPMLNRAIQAQLAPGSVFKIIESVGMLESGVPPANFHVFCPGYGIFYGQIRHDWNPKGHGEVDLHKAIAESCDVFFYNVGMQMGIDRISYYAKALGLGKETGIDLPGEEPGLVPSSAWVERVYHHAWYPGSTISLAIGQGPIEVTPIQLLRSVSGIAMDGVFYQPHLLKDLQPKVVKFPIPKSIVDEVTGGMYGVVNEPGGTGVFADDVLKQDHLQKIDFCGKTGTAQTISAEALLRLSAAERKHYRYDTWFVGFAPQHDPEIAVVVLVQGSALEAGGVAAPIAARVVAAYYQKKMGQPIQELEAQKQPQKKRPGTQAAKPASAASNQ